SFNGSVYDFGDINTTVESYTIWRHYQDDYWDAVGSFNAVQDSMYFYVAPTLCDSTSEGICWSTFKVSAHTTNPDIFYFSDILSGYSIDNIAPAVPTGLIASVGDGVLNLSWDGSVDEDFQYYGIYRSTQSGFNPDTMDSYTYATADTSFTDSVVTIDITYYYRISAFDYSGNESGYSAQVGDTYLDVDDALLIPKQFTLHPNHPNPFNPITSLRYDLPEQAQVTLTVYDLMGREVTQLVNTVQEAGYRSVQWDATDMHGKPVSAGVYLYQIRAGEFVQTRKMVLLK
ncbi:MAG: FlgD immunoglobulin-like domain containing protein, partial [Candidatus Marinimicrobia bacterium]|nr:FlgD immunoglobulin-like domain containing protein [Candidatus Neomarinimicrobiota bacterium]